MSATRIHSLGMSLTAFDRRLRLLLLQVDTTNSSRTRWPVSWVFGFYFSDLIFGYFLASNEATSYSSTPRLDPFEAAPFNPAQLKRYFERQQSSEASLASSNPSSGTSGAPSISSKPYLVHVGSSASSEGHLPSTSKSNSTVITIRSNNDFVIHSNGQSEAGLPSSNIIASSSSAFVSLAPPAVVNAIDPLTAQSNSSSSQGICPQVSPTSLATSASALASLPLKQLGTHSRNNSLPTNWQTFT